MRGSAKSQFDGDIIIKIEKGETFRQNEVFHDKNHYQNKDLSLLRYNIYHQGLAGGLLNAVPVADIQSQNSEMGAVWENMTVTL